ncbi:MAG TPA: phosphopantothenoylcysteine decarboxylase [Streptosporangiaceae bacterium]|jgi:phosphopantothenoylcysteine decarboxylase/phosphopantothenate--cysteine ligase
MSGGYDGIVMAPIAESAFADLYVGSGADIHRGLEICAALAQAGLHPRVCLSPGAVQAVPPGTWVAAGGEVTAGDLTVPNGEAGQRVTVLACAGPGETRWPSGLIPDVLVSTAPAGAWPDAVIPADPGHGGPAVTITAAAARPAAPATYAVIVLDAVRYVLSRRNGPLTGKRLVVTGGGTREPVDPVRFITNRSSGRMGHAIADAARDYGADVTLITSAPHLPAAVGVRCTGFDTVEALRAVVLAATARADCLVMAAAVSDYRPASAADHKLKKSPGGLDLHLDTVPNFMSEIPPGVLRVGFAAETCADLEYVAGKRVSRGFDLICLNDVSRPDGGFEVDTNQITMVGPEGVLLSTDLLSKAEVARVLLGQVAPLLAGRPARESTR